MAPPSTAYPPPSALTSRIEASALTTHEAHYHHLAIQILHNLQYQHDWTSLRIHTHSTLPSASDPSPLLPRPLISGRPPERVYVHPDEQAEMIKHGIKEARVGSEREWVLPTHLREKWSLRRMAEIFDAVEVEPGAVDGDGDEGGGEGVGEDKGGGALEDKGIKRRRGGKRMMLATLGDDGTVVYYIVHEGLVKPRQN